ncbi:MAG TPA: 3-phosphoglycerate dehydrogenase [Parvularcula sp.]|nr:3-phosphoglycerate dehydrogenase [Parvularcula sp.]HBS31089.1 3-phosphoglycerate dehydrogenase [Parvularcula sp.]HBS33831.1 3-phosphoglycerate dehydrogenase [Parvularcula sp.]
MPEIVISEFLDEAAIASILKGRDVFYDPKLVDEPARLHAALKDARAIVVRNRTQVRSALLDASPRLAVVGRLGVGLDNIDIDACKARSIDVFPATGANDIAVAEYVIAAAMILVRRAYDSSAEVAGGKWPRNALIGGEVFGRTLGLVGYGAIARLTAARARALGMEVAAYDPYLPADDAHWRGVRNLPLHSLLAEADIVSLHTPLSEETRHMIGAAAIGEMKKSAVLINAARGGVVDETALAGALQEGRIAGAALDVFEEEPLGPAAGAKFAGLKNVILTPHIAGVTQESNVRVSRVTLENVAAALDRRR